MTSSPKFITPLVDRSVIAGYSAAISCAVRGYPKVSVSVLRDYINLLPVQLFISHLSNNALYFSFSVVLLPAKDYMDEK